MLKSLAPGTFHKKFSFQHFEHVEPGLFDQEIEQVLNEEVDGTPGLLYGFDRSGQNIRAAKANAERAGVEDLIHFERADATQLEPPVEQGMIVTNPPYGIRLGDEFFLEELYKNFSFNLKKNYGGWHAWILSGDAAWTRFLKMKAEQRFPLDNGGVDCRWIHYKILASR